MSDAQVAGGHKANLKNPNTSEESKEHSREVLKNQTSSGGGDDFVADDDNSGKNPNNVAGGLKAALKNPNVSDEAKESAKQRLDGMDA
ncbi:Conidiation protein 6-domain-containing protein [Dactylonectria macrodidyma]|uniref:Conidiation protein 6-domain-containing protein n=1 Tax=Dactylonectria macrodidyma TaxID=307937 RepID=A0A9P9F0J8_9HYPO|nr:Conidiation protein 6-domain-containing protein [Dactylonectria macrodidyma]